MLVAVTCTQKVVRMEVLGPLQGESRAKMSMVWGTRMNQKIQNFQLWEQGFVFSKAEPLALEQTVAGTATLLAGVQAHLVRRVVFDYHQSIKLPMCSEEEKSKFLCETLSDIMALGQKHMFQVAFMSSAYHKMQRRRPVFQDPHQTVSLPSLESPTEPHADPSNVMDIFHDNVRVMACQTERDMRNAVNLCMKDFMGHYGVILFLYSVLLSKNSIYRALHPRTMASSSAFPYEDPDPVEFDPTNLALVILDPDSGLGRQPLVDMLVAGDPVIMGSEPHHRIPVGIIAQSEDEDHLLIPRQLRNPHYPVWVMFDREHYTVFFSDDINLCRQRNFRKHELPRSEVAEVTKYRVYHYNSLPRANPFSAVKFSEGVLSLAKTVERFCSDRQCPVTQVLRTKWQDAQVMWNPVVVLPPEEDGAP